jgi:hypothetical protein
VHFNPYFNKPDANQILHLLLFTSSFFDLFFGLDWLGSVGLDLLSKEEEKKKNDFFGTSLINFKANL